VEIFLSDSVPKDKKILPEPCLEKSPYIESESIRPIKSLIKVDISVVLEI